MASTERRGSVGKRAHVVTEKMQQYIESQIHPDRSDTSRVFRCAVAECGRTFTSCPGLRYHMKTHSGPERPYTCPRCHKTFKSFNGLKYHTAKTRCSGDLADDPGDLVIDLTQSDSDSCADDMSDGSDIVIADDDDDTLPKHAQPPDKIPENITQRRFLEHDLPRLTIKTSPLKSHDRPTTAASCDVRTMEEDNPATSRWEGDAEFCPPYGECSRLVELANIATSPLVLQNRPVNPPRMASTTSKLTPQDTSDVGNTEQRLTFGNTTNDSHRLTNGCPGDTRYTELTCDVNSHSFPSPVTSPECPHYWPHPVWKCFLKDVRIRLHHEADWLYSQDLAQSESHTGQDCPCSDITLSSTSTTLRLECIEACTESQSPINSISLSLGYTDPDSGDDRCIVAVCPSHHPFYVKNKGWSASNPSEASKHHALPCSELAVGDIFCVDPIEYSQSYDAHFWSYLTPMDSNAVVTLSNMAQKKKHEASSPTKAGAPPIPPSPGKVEALKVKRPMNGFMLFAKRCRVDITQKHPGKDNRTISIMLGDMWKKMSAEERERYALEARELADQQRRINPDCWKRRKPSEQ